MQALHKVTVTREAPPEGDSQQESAVHMFLVSCIKTGFESNGKARISLIILCTQPRRSAITLFEIFPGTMSSLLQDHRHALAFELR